MNQVFLFMKKPIKVLSTHSLQSEKQWTEFLENESKKYRDEAYEVTVVLNSPQLFASEGGKETEMKSVDVVLITTDKVCMITY